MNFKSIHSFIFVLLLALTSNNLHQWQPHAEDSVCEVCLLSSHDGVIPAETDLHIQIAELTVHQWKNIEHKHLVQGAFIEPIRGSPIKNT
ncbi:hypothetical protein [Marinicella rhabdoformis]|uniref:hypothetical protein n=1 Tax=Marinicella rhabdoformis TaxID=2580566 RepID=UPI0012AEBA3D|nr:hypothetical protein [Marinicella rhabdoformis]